MQNNIKGKVFLVGAGPGDPGLLTLRGAEILKSADVVIYDALVNPAILNYTKPIAEKILAGKRSCEYKMPQEEINRLLLKYALEGKTIVRLKGGDPFTFGRGGEEAMFLAENGIEFEIVPGVSSIQAVPAYAGIPITHRNLCPALTVISGHIASCEKNGETYDYSPFAAIPGTKVLLMATAKIRAITQDFIKGGMSPDTPVAVIQWGTLGRQKTVTGTLATIADIVEKSEISPPTVIVVGEIVKFREKLNWFESRPLFGQRVVVTRSREQSGALSALLRERGADVLEVPTIKIAPPTKPEDLMDALLGLNEYDWLVFTSPNGVTAFFEHFFKRFDDLRDIGGTKIAAIGPGTAAKLKEYHLRIDLMPEESLGSKIAKAFAAYESIENLRICLLRAEVANQELPKALEDLGAIVDDIACYRTIPETDDSTGAGKRLLDEGADWILFTSGSTVENFHLRFGLPDLVKKFSNIRLAAIGPETSKTIESFGLKPTVVAKEHNIGGLVKAVEDFISEKRNNI
ncbi:MAG: uroporphyrinogen-III C-methyltransferase [Verrucomicrobiia bacterium]|jgi:uroporphyrinogen III methyltransferase/synthase